MHRTRNPSTSSTHDLTFGNVYERRKEDVYRNIHSRHRQRSAQLHASNESVDELMFKVLAAFRDARKNKLVTVKHFLGVKPHTLQIQASQWVDENGLNLLHYCILYNAPDVMEYLLGELHLFGTGTKPTTNPYAHLAATIGLAECLKVIFTYRPEDFFTSSEAWHTIRLPLEFTKKFKLNEPFKSGINRKLLDKISDISNRAEQRLLDETVTTDVVDDLENEIQKLENSRKKSCKYRDSKPKIIDVSEKEREQVEPVPSYHLPELKQKPKTGRPTHQITVYQDCFSDLPDGVIGSAGASVKMVNKIGQSNSIISVPEQHRSASGHTHKPAFSVKNMPSENKNKNAVVLPPPKVTISKPDSVHQSPSMGGNGRISGNRHSGGQSNLGLRRPSLSYCDLNKLQPSFNKIEMGVRTIKKYKQFKVHLEPHKPRVKYDQFMDKTPLMLAAERGHLECVRVTLEKAIRKLYKFAPSNEEPLTLATRARSPHSIALLLSQKVNHSDYQRAVLLSIEEFYPDCLAALMINKNKDRSKLFEGANLYHVLFTRSLNLDSHFELLPEMTRVLIQSKENVNQHAFLRTHPLYTLINCAFKLNNGAHFKHYNQCLESLLIGGADPHFNEVELEQKDVSSFARKPFSSVVHCLIQNAQDSVFYFESDRWSKLFLRKLLLTVEEFDITPRRILGKILFDYMDCVCTLGLDQTIIRCLLRYGANPDFKLNGKYAINLYFDKILPFLVHFEVTDSFNHYQKELSLLMIISRYMSYKSLKECLMIFLNEHLLTTPVQALPLCRYFSWLMNEKVYSPRPLKESCVLHIWLRLGRNAKKAQQLRLRADILYLIVP